MLSLGALLSFAIYRVTRFLVEDSLIHRQRLWIQRKIVGSPEVGERTASWRVKLVELSECPYCISVWIAAAVVGLTDAVVSVPLPVWMWLATAGGSMTIWRITEAE